MAHPPVPRTQRRFRVPPFRPGKIIKLAIWCLVVGLILAALDLSPEEFWSGAFSFVKGVWDWLISVFGRLGSYVVLGAAIVLPIWAVGRLYRRLRR